MAGRVWETMKKKKKINYSKAKREAWKIFSLYIRTRDSHNGEVECFTCNFIFPIKQIQAGHFIPGRRNSLLFNETNCHPQCMQCNVYKKGNLIEYYPRMVEKYGLDVIEKLKDLNYQITQYKVADLIEIKDKYQVLLDQLGEK